MGLRGPTPYKAEKDGRVHSEEPLSSPAPPNEENKRVLNYATAMGTNGGTAQINGNTMPSFRYVPVGLVCCCTHILKPRSHADLIPI